MAEVVSMYSVMLLGALSRELPLHPLETMKSHHIPKILY